MTAYRPCDDCDEEVCAVRRLMIEARTHCRVCSIQEILADMLDRRPKRRPARSNQVNLNPRATLIVQQSSLKARIKKPTGLA